jgi:hypothetical protein
VASYFSDTQRPALKFFAIDLPQSNILRTINAPSSLSQTFMMAINQNWTNGMSNARTLDSDCHIYTLNGQPWSSGSPADDPEMEEHGQLHDALRARRLLSSVFEMLNEQGWRLTASIQLNGRMGGPQISFSVLLPKRTMWLRPIESTEMHGAFL